MTTKTKPEKLPGMCSARCKHKLVWYKTAEGKQAQKRWCQTEQAKTAPRSLGEALGAFPVETEMDRAILAVITKVAK